MAKEKGNIDESTEAKIANKLGNWKSIIGFILFISMGVGNYMITDYRVDLHEEKLEKLEEKIDKKNDVNYELIVRQLQDIQAANNELTNKIEKTNERVDKVLEILIRK